MKGVHVVSEEYMSYQKSSSRRNCPYNYHRRAESKYYIHLLRVASQNPCFSELLVYVAGIAGLPGLSGFLELLATLDWMRQRQFDRAVERRRFSAAPLSVKGLESTATSMGEFVIQKFV